MAQGDNVISPDKYIASVMERERKILSWLQHALTWKGKRRFEAEMQKRKKKILELEEELDRKDREKKNSLVMLH